MSGYEVNRFVGLTQSQTEEFRCSICLGVLSNPVDTQCGHTFCFDCISEWALIQDNTCPECRHPLKPPLGHSANESNADSSGQTIPLTKPYNKFFNLWQNLKIKCNFYDSGCLEVLSLKTLAKHLEECVYNKCPNCELRVGKPDEHNCLDQLKHELKNRIIKNDMISEQLKQLKESLDQLEKKYTKDVQTLKLDLENVTSDKLLVEIEKYGLINKLRRFESNIDPLYH